MRSPESALVALILLASSCSQESHAVAPLTPPPATVFGKSVALEALSDELTYPARVIPKINTTVLAESDGVISTQSAVLGQVVERGQTLMVISHTDPIYKYAPMKVRSPITGIVSSIEVSEGAQINKGDKLASVTDPKKLRIVIEVPAEDLPSLQKDAPGELRISSSGGSVTTIAVKLHGISPFIDPAIGTATCEFELSDPNAVLAPGVVGRVQMKVHERKAIRVPEFAILYKSQAPFVRIYDGGKIRFANVQLGKKQEGYVELLSGVKEGDTVVERASRFVPEGEAVQLDSGNTAGEGHAS